MEQLGLQESVGVGCCGRSAHERLMEALMWPGPSMRSHAELLTGGRLLLVVLGHLPLQHGLLVLLLLQIVLIEGVLILRHGKLVVHHGVRLRGVQALPRVGHERTLRRHL